MKPAVPEHHRTVGIGWVRAIVAAARRGGVWQKPNC